MRGAVLLAILAIAGCRRLETAPLPAPPPDHTPAFVTDHARLDGCDRCHHEDACARCHRTRAPVDHRPGYAGPAHAVDARLAPERCATCHTRATCATCHPPR